MRLQRISSSVFALILLVLGANALLLVLSTRAYDAVVSAQEHRRKALALSNALQRETDQLSRMVNAYTATGESRYLLYYYDILGARLGEKAAPDASSAGAYWDDVVAGRRRHAPRADGPRQSLAERMASLGYSSSELAALRQVLDVTVAMNEVEQKAFAATQGLYDPDTGRYVADGAIRLDYATQLVHGAAYNALKADLSEAVEALIRMLDQRTGAQVAAADRSLNRYLALSLAAMAATILLALLALHGIRRNALLPIASLGQATDRLAEGDYSTRVGALRGFEELGALGRTVDTMAEAIQGDLAHRQAVQRELEAARQLAEQATKTKSRFLAHMSHEIRTPMNAILGMTHLAQRSGLAPRQQDYVDKIHAAAGSLLAVINDLLDLSKVEAGRLELARTCYCVEDVARDALWLVRQQAIDKGLRLSCSIADARLMGDAGAFIGDPLRLGQVLTNLLANAVRFTHDGHVRLVIQTESPGPDVLRLRFEVHDTGIGLTEVQARRLFEDFAQADGETVLAYGGTGLGLAISRRVVECMGGRIGVDSQEGAGAIFRFTIPCEAAPVSAGALSPATAAGSGHFLLLDPDPFARQALADLLGVIEHAATSPRMACIGSLSEFAAVWNSAKDAGHPFERLFIAESAVVESGDAAWSTVHSDLTGDERNRVILITAADGSAGREAAAGLGLRHHLATPVMPRALAACLQGEYLPPATRGGPARGVMRRSEGLAGRRVLLVEDNAVNRQVATELLESEGVEVVAAVNGQQALERLGQAGAPPFDLVLLDLQMPVMDGYEFTRRLRGATAHQGLPIVAHSAHAMADERARCLSLGMQAHLPKPIEPAALFECLRAVLQVNVREMHTESAVFRQTLVAAQASADLSSAAEQALRPIIDLLRAGDNEGRSRWQALRSQSPDPMSPLECTRVDAALAAFDFSRAASLIEGALDGTRSP